MALQPPIIEYDARLISPGVNLTLTGVGTPNLTATYSDFGSGGGAAKAHCVLSISYTNISWTIDEDTAVVTVTGNISGAQLVRTATGVVSTQQQEITAWFNNQVTFHQFVTTGSSGTYNLNIPTSFSVAVDPLQQRAYPAAIHFKNDNTTSTAVPDEFALGILVTNPNPPDYRPGATRASSQWLSHNRSGGAANIYTGNAWRTMRTLDGGVSSDNPPLIRHASGWKNMRKIGNG